MSLVKKSLGKNLLAVLMVFSILMVSGLGYFFMQDRSPHVEKNVIGVLTVEGLIISADDVNKYSSLINSAIADNSIKGVVLRVNSPGGYAHYVEQLYLDLVELGKNKPLTASIITALSGGYYISVSSEYIFVLPTSSVGNIGVIGTAPPTLVPSENVLESGVYKMTGSSKLFFPFNLTSALDNFVSAVENGRGAKLKLSMRGIRRGMVYLGSDSVRLGLADELGSLQKAVQKTASLADLTSYQTVSLNELYRAEPSQRTSNTTGVDWRDININTLNLIHPPPALFYLYLPSTGTQEGIYSVESTGQNNTLETSNSYGDVLVDISHGNKFPPWDFDILMAELAKNDVTLGFLSDWDELAAALQEKASCLIIASPTNSYSRGEVNQIEEFVEKGGTLLLFSDPASEYLESTELQGPVNSVAINFGISFANGYLYNEIEHFGFYRNIYLKNFEDTNLTRNLTSIVMFTSCNVYSKNPISHTGEGTFSSTAEKTADYSPIAVENRNGTIIAFGDLTFLTEPYCYVEDNYILIENMIQIIKSVNVPEASEQTSSVEHRLEEPEIKVGTEKLFSEEIDGETHTMRWVKLSETEVLIERPDRVSKYYYDEEGSLIGWDSNGMSASYETPIPKTPYPLVYGGKWSYSSKYNLFIENEEITGNLKGEEEVVDFVEVKAFDENRYLCAVISSTLVDVIERTDNTIKIISTTSSWISYELGLIREESNTQTIVNDFPVATENRVKVLTDVNLD